MLHLSFPTPPETTSVTEFETLVHQMRYNSSFQTTYKDSKTANIQKCTIRSPDSSIGFDGFIHTEEKTLTGKNILHIGGAPQIVVTYNADEEGNTSITGYREDGAIRYTSFRDEIDCLTNDLIEYHNGEPLRCFSYEENRPHGLYQDFYSTTERSPKRTMFLKKGIADGRFRFNHENGNSLSFGLLKNGVPVGEWELCNDRGEPYFTAQYNEAGYPIALLDDLFKDGKPLFENKINEKQQRVGSWAELNLERQMVCFLSYNDEGERRGWQSAKYLNGSCSFKQYIDEGGVILEEIHLFPDGRTARKKTANDKLSIIERYHENGILAEYSVYGANKKKNGLCERRNPDGTIISKGMWRNGERYGLYNESDILLYYWGIQGIIPDKFLGCARDMIIKDKKLSFTPTGRLMAPESGVRNSDPLYQFITSTYDREKFIQTVKKWEKTVSISTSYYDDAVTVKASGPRDRAGRQQGLWRYFHENGFLCARGEIVNDKKNGEWRFYNVYGAITSQARFKEGKRVENLPIHP
jgi:antitoxin component YwqK of YwqJK toxin-antitoxin module